MEKSEGLWLLHLIVSITTYFVSYVKKEKK